MRCNLSSCFSLQYNVAGPLAVCADENQMLLDSVAACVFIAAPHLGPCTVASWFPQLPFVPHTVPFLADLQGLEALAARFEHATQGAAIPVLGIAESLTQVPPIMSNVPR